METLLNRADAETRVLFGMAEAEMAQHALWWASAEVFRAIDATLQEAAEHPEVFIDSGMLRADAVEYAQRAAAADLAVRLNMAEATVRSHGATAHTLRTRLPQIWAWFREGEISTQNAREAADLAVGMPEASWAAFDAGLLEAAKTLAPARFRRKARALREKLHAETPRSTPQGCERGAGSVGRA